MTHYEFAKYVKWGVNTSSKKPQIQTTKVFSSLRREKLFLGYLNLPGKTKETTLFCQYKQINGELIHEGVLVVGILGFFELVFVFPFSM